MTSSSSKGFLLSITALFFYALAILIVVLVNVVPDHTLAVIDSIKIKYVLILFSLALIGLLFGNAYNKSVLTHPQKTYEKVMWSLLSILGLAQGAPFLISGLSADFGEEKYAVTIEFAEQISNVANWPICIVMIVTLFLHKSVCKV